MLFSKRKGLSPVRDTIQKEDMDDVLRNGLWNVMTVFIWRKNEYEHYSGSFESSIFYKLFQLYYYNLFKIPLDRMPDGVSNVIEKIRKYFFDCEWYEVYDLIEFTAQNCPKNLTRNFVNACNNVLQKELSAYRFVDEQLADITNEEEIESIETAITDGTKYSGVHEHLNTALGLLSDRKSPDYRNSVKESISAVEALCVSISGDRKATLGSALNMIEKSHQLHPAFKKALSNLYGFTSDSNGIRHALLEKSAISYNDAKYMLVSCSAFINYVIGKISEQG